jgi:hypothetical protein
MERIAGLPAYSTQLRRLRRTSPFVYIALICPTFGTSSANDLSEVGGPPLPCLRLYSRDVPIDQKRVIAQKLIEITDRTFHMPAEAPKCIAIQFIPLSRLRAVEDLHPEVPRDADFALEVSAHGLTERRKRAFAEEATSMLARMMPMKPKSRFARLLGIKADTPSQVALQFNELSQEEWANSDPFVVDPAVRSVFIAPAILATAQLQDALASLHTAGPVQPNKY